MYRWVDHTAELELRIEAATEEAVFADALAAFAELVDDGGSASESQLIELEAGDPGLLLADWLNELVFLADRDGFVPASVEELELEPGRLRARVLGRYGEPRPLVKAVSLHGLEYRADREQGWRARLVLDV